MTEKTLIELKSEMIEIMREVKGPDYTMGWLTSAYVYSNMLDHDMERELVIKMINELVDEKVMAALKNQS